MNVRPRRQFVIKLSDFAEPREISNLFKNDNIIYYAYEFFIAGETIKFGQSTCLTAGMAIERVYRQCGGIPGWDCGFLESSSALVMRREMEKYFPSVTKNDISVRLFDFSHIPPEFVKYVVDNFETKMILDYRDARGSYPKLNKQINAGYTPNPERLNEFFEF